jgi:hypothetical protein
MTFFTILMMVISIFAMVLHLAIVPLFGFGYWLAKEMNVTYDRLMDYVLAGMIAPYIVLAVVGIIFG